MIHDLGRRKRLWNLRRVMLVLLGLSVLASVFQDSDGAGWAALRTAVLFIHAIIWIVWSGVIGKELDRTKPLEVPLRQEVPPTQKRSS